METAPSHARATTSPPADTDEPDPKTDRATSCCSINAQATRRARKGLQKAGRGGRHPAPTRRREDRAVAQEPASIVTTAAAAGNAAPSKAEHARGGASRWLEGGAPPRSDAPARAPGRSPGIRRRRHLDSRRWRRSPGEHRRRARRDTSQEGEPPSTAGSCHGTRRCPAAAIRRADLVRRPHPVTARGGQRWEGGPAAARSRVPPEPPLKATRGTGEGVHDEEYYIDIR